MKDYNFNDDVGLTETCILFRKHTPLICKMNEHWTEMVRKCIRDQISFDFLKWLYKIKYNTINSDYRPILKVAHGT